MRKRVLIKNKMWPCSPYLYLNVSYVKGPTWVPSGPDRFTCESSICNAYPWFLAVVVCPPSSFNLIEITH